MRWVVTLDPHAPIPTAEKIHRDIDGALRGRIDLERRIQERVQSTPNSLQFRCLPLRWNFFLTHPPIRLSSKCVAMIDQGSFSISVLPLRCRVDIRSAIVTTLGAEAIDTLYVNRDCRRPVDA